ncbi:hypothetical protein [Sedimenticola hydrogenitrophicus]|uniref:hypothetical protein n=1 Tax=Sedimenticola hydrogenitrophicus TaxID=2967975 RepID=UPI0021A4588E|nr:hypothetical protein [Sedimenticola hydrogenitrophicus]
MYAPHSQHPIRLPRLALLSLLLCFLSPAVLATSQLDDGTAAWTANRSLEAAGNGLIYSLPVIDRQQLVKDIQALNQQLKLRQEDLSEKIQKNSFTATDALIVAAMPGGLIYAAVKRQRSRQAEKELDLVNSQLDSLAGFGPIKMPSAQPAMLVLR